VQHFASQFIKYTFLDQKACIQKSKILLHPMQSYPATHARTRKGHRDFTKKSMRIGALGRNMNVSKCQMRVERDRNKQTNIKTEIKKRKEENESKKTDSVLQQMEDCVVASRR